MVYLKLLMSNVNVSDFSRFMGYRARTLKLSDHSMFPH